MWSTHPPTSIRFWISDYLGHPAKEFGERLAYIHLNPVRKALVDRPEDWVWSSYNKFSLDRPRVARCPIQIDYSDM